MTGVQRTNPLRVIGTGRGELALRVGSALVLVPLAITTAYLGGWWFTGFWGIAAGGTFWEWSSLIGASQCAAVMITGASSLAVAVALAATGHPAAALVALAIGAIAAAAMAPAPLRVWHAAGIPYAGSVAVMPIMLRSDPDYGLVAILFLFAIVWVTDIAAYFSGRAIGGAKLWPRVSPKKTWSGAIAGTAAAIVAGLLVASAAQIPGLWAIAGLAVLLSASAQGGDLFESFLKRKFRAKDSSQLIPGHGGVMDRLDAFVAATVVAALIGIVRAGFQAPGRGLLMW